jgi:hypothetical protein
VLFPEAAGEHLQIRIYRYTLDINREGRMSKRILIVVMSDRQERYETLTQLCGFKGFLLKPFGYAELKNKLEAAVGK